MVFTWFVNQRIVIYFDFHGISTFLETQLYKKLTINYTVLHIMMGPDIMRLLLLLTYCMKRQTINGMYSSTCSICVDKA